MPRIVLQLLGALIGIVIAFGLGLAFNTGTDAAQFEIGIYCAVGAIAGFYAGRIVHMVIR